LVDLLSAFEQDVVQQAYGDRAGLLDYCRRSANPIGRLLLHLYGIDDQDALSASDAICTALQLINFWQDLSVDLARGRNYLPGADCERCGIGADAWATRDDRIDDLVRDLVHWSAEIMARGAELPLRVPGRAGWELRLVVHGGWRILEKICGMGFRTYLHRPRLTAGDAPLLLWRALHFSPRQLRADALR
jgi:hydroxysqualene synthase